MPPQIGVGVRRGKRYNLVGTPVHGGVRYHITDETKQLHERGRVREADDVFSYHQARALWDELEATEASRSPADAPGGA